MSLHLRPGPAKNMKTPIASTSLERDASNFDFRVVTLLMVLITRPDLLKEYLDDGKEKDAYNVPLAVKHSTKWKTLRILFDVPMLAEMLYLFELPETQKCIRHLLTAFRTMNHFEEYEFNGCPNFNFIRAVVAYSRQQTAALNTAGSAVDEGTEI